MRPSKLIIGCAAAGWMLATLSTHTYSQNPAPQPERVSTADFSFPVPDGYLVTERYGRWTLRRANHDEVGGIRVISDSVLHAANSTVAAALIESLTAGDCDSFARALDELNEEDVVEPDSTLAGTVDGTPICTLYLRLGRRAFRSSWMSYSGYQISIWCVTGDAAVLGACDEIIHGWRREREP